ncbi:MAG: hypothetical protein WC044_05800 [Crocinitomicaceae bacterium]
MKKLIDRYSKGKIQIKFHLVTPVTSNRKRKIILSIGLMLFLTFTFYVIPKILQNLNLTGLIPIGIGLGVFWLLFDFIIRIWLFKINEIGIIKFLPETMQIQTTDNLINESISYSEVKGIRYQRNVPRTVLTNTPDTKTFIVEFVRYENKPIIIEVENNMFVTKKDENQFRTPEPDLETVLSYINAKYGVERVKKINTPNIK